MTDETRRLRRVMDRRGRRRAVIALVATALIFAVAGWGAASLGRQATAEQQRADTAVSGAEQLCQQVRQLGGTCVVDPAELKGDPGERGDPGPPGQNASDDQVRAAVDQYFARNPPQPGRDPSPAEIAVAVINYLTVHPPSPGPPGKNATPEQVATAVRAYLTENPPAAGPKGDKGERGEQGEQGPGLTAEQIAEAVKAYLSRNPLPHCPAGSHIEEYKPLTDSRTFLVCAKD